MGCITYPLRFGQGTAVANSKARPMSNGRPNQAEINPPGLRKGIALS